MSPTSGDNAEYFFKIIIVGDYRTGKTSLLCKYTNQEYEPSSDSTMNVDFSVKTLERNNKKIKLQIWDTAGQERFRTATASYYRGARGVLLVYDITKRESFHNIIFWYSEMVRHCVTDSVKAIVIGNKCHLNCDREVSSVEGKQLAENIGLPFYETSSVKNINVTECFDELVDSILLGLERQEINRNLDSITLPDNKHWQNRHEVEGCSC
ncbi:GTP-binding protein ypt2-like [Actinia tenebrosa]|uniref:GTP-binding protein ypt2-like n=1 Tax=Actinia tenebrosa TaxID=6105 RepID=A0A6P8JCF6_ACTTE|nr:GTP-binding protein ypt2-like [Actinia tenebrosa]